MWTLLLLSGALLAHGRSPDPYAGCRAEPFSDDGFIHRCPGLVMTEVPSPATTARVALSMVQDHYRGPSGTARETQLTIAGEDFPVVLLEQDGAQSLLTALAIPKRGMRVLHCATSAGDEEGLRRCAALAGRAQAYGLGNRSTTIQTPPDSAQARPLSSPTPDLDEALTSPRTHAGPTETLAQFRGRTVDVPSGCEWRMTGEDTGRLTCPSASLTFGKVPINDSSATLEQLTAPHVAAVKEGGMAGRIKRMSASCRLDLIDAKCVDLHLNPAQHDPYRVLNAVIEDRGTTWFATCRQSPPQPSIPVPCDRLISGWPPIGMTRP